MSLISDVCEKQPLLDFLSPPDEKDTEIILERVLSDLHAGQLSFVNDTETWVYARAMGQVKRDLYWRSVCTCHC